MKNTRIITAASVALLVAMTGACSNNKATTSAASASAAEKEYEAKLRALKEREAALAAKESAIQAAASSQKAAPAPAPAPAPVAMAGDSLLPPNARPGECYARVWVPPKFRTVTEKVLKKAEGEKLEIIPAKYEWTTEKVLVSEGGEKLITMPPKYKTVTEKIKVRDGETFWTFSTNGPRAANSPNAKLADDRRLAAARSGGANLDGASVGSCFAEYYIPAKYGTKTEKVLVREPGSRIEVIPAKYGTVTEKVLVREASEKVVTVPAKYKTVTEKVLVRPAYTTWKVSECSGGACLPGEVPGRVPGSKERIDQATGEVMCLVEIPAQYRTITKRVMVSPPTTKRITIPAEYKTVTIRKMLTPPQERTVEIPAEYKTVTKKVKIADAETYWCPVGTNGKSCKSPSGNVGQATGDALCLLAKPEQYKTITKRVLAEPAKTKRVSIPPQYKTVKVRKLVSPPQERRITIPASYQTVTRTEKVSDGHMQWMPVLCQVNMTREKIKEIQRALKKAGYYRGPIDGIVASQTIAAMRKFQDAKGLTPTRYLTLETVRALGVAAK